MPHNNIVCCQGDVSATPSFNRDSKKSKALESWLAFTATKNTKKKFSSYDVDIAVSKETNTDDSMSAHSVWTQPSFSEGVPQYGQVVPFASQSEHAGTYLQELERCDSFLSASPISIPNSPQYPSPMSPYRVIPTPRSCYSGKEGHEFSPNKIDRPDKAFRKMIVRAPKYTIFEFRRADGKWSIDGESKDDSASSVPSLSDSLTQTSASSVCMEPEPSDSSMICIDDRSEGEMAVSDGSNNKQWYSPVFLREYTERQEVLSTSEPYKNPLWHPNCDFSGNSDRKGNKYGKKKYSKKKHTLHKLKNRYSEKKQHTKPAPQLVPNMQLDFPGLPSAAKAQNARAAAVSKWQSKKMFWGKKKSSAESSPVMPPLSSSRSMSAWSADDDRSFVIADSETITSDSLNDDKSPWKRMAPSYVPEVPKSPPAPTQRVPDLGSNEFPSL